jgi:2-dehydro-3-deoxygalactonokinase
MTRWAEGFIAVDWGTTNRRAYLLDEHGLCTDEFEDDQGILKLGRGEFEAAVAQVRERLGDKPMLLAGMIGSNRGWIEAPYVPCPAGFAELAASLAWAEDRSVAIVPGVCVDKEDPDVMRGEEVQLVGAMAHAEIPGDCVVCHPGTHNKWVVVDHGRIAAFRTVLTGELFSLLKDRSMLSDLLGGEAVTGEAFLEGARRWLAGSGISAQLIGARARALLGQLDRADGASYVSGLLIGEDVRFGLSTFAPSKVYLLGRPELTALYSAVLDLAGIESPQSSGEQAFVAGAAKIVEAIR